MFLVVKGYFSSLCLMGILLVSGNTSGALRVDRENVATPEKVEFFKEELTTCREGFESRSVNQKIPGYACPQKVPKLYSRALKYQPGKDKCWHNGKRVPFPAFCRGEVLQLRLVLGESFHGNVSSETAIEVNWGIASEAPFFCPENSGKRTAGSSGNCLSQLCQQKLPLRTGDTKGTFGQFYQVNNTWVLNLTLREKPGHYSLAFRVFTCEVAECALWQSGGKVVRDDCCFIGSNFDLTVIDFERNRVGRPATYAGNGQYNVTLFKNDAYREVTVIDVVDGGTVKNVSTPDGFEELCFILGRGVYQVTGETNRGCSAGELINPVVLEPRNATYGSVEFVDFFSRSLRWSLVSDIPVERFDFYSQKNTLHVTQINRHHTDHQFSLDGNAAKTVYDHAPVHQVFVHRVVYQGVKDTENPTEVFHVDLSDFLPLNMTVSYNSSHAFAEWATPVAYPEYVVAYKLWVNDSKDHFVQKFNVYGTGKVAKFSYRPRNLFVPDEVIIISVAAVYQNNTISRRRAWFGPMSSATIIVAHTGTQSSPKATSGAVSTPILTASHTVFPSLVSSPVSGYGSVVGQTGTIVGASVAGGVAVVVFIAASVAAVCIYKFRTKSDYHLLDDATAVAGLNEKMIAVTFIRAHDSSVKAFIESKPGQPCRE